MKISNIVGSINRILDLQTDIILQQLILTAMWAAISRLGRNEINISELTSVVEEKLQIIKSQKLNINRITLYNSIQNLSRYPIELECIFKDDSLTFKFKYSELELDTPEMKCFADEIEVKGIFKGPDYSNIIHKKIDEIEKLSDKLKYYESIETRFVVTSSLTNKREIWDEATKIISNAVERIYLMIAFYEEDLAFERLIISIAKRNIDLKILYRYSEEENLRLVEKLQEEIQKKNAFRGYAPRFLCDREMQYIGNLHSKMVLTENFLLVGSANLTANSLKKNEESAIITNDPNAIKAATDQFMEVWECFY